MKRTYAFLFALVILLSPSITLAQDEAVTNDTPKWLDRVDIGAEIGSDEKPTWYFETVQPIYQTPTEDETVFIQPRASKTGDDETYNLGIGYRWLTPSENCLLGVNTFYDHAAEHSHYRVGVGLEAIGKVLEGRLNTYWGLSDKRIVKETSTATTYEEVVDGADFEIGGPIIPYTPWLKLYGSGFWFDHEHGDERRGWRARLRIDPIKCIDTGLVVWDDNKGNTEVRADISVTIPFDTWSDFQEAFKLAEQEYKDRDLKEEMLVPVERDYEVKVEKWVESKTGGATVEIGRD